MAEKITLRPAGIQGKASGRQDRAEGQDGVEAKDKAGTEGQHQKPSNEQIAQQRREELFEVRREQVRKAANGAKIPYKEAAGAIGIVSNLQDEHEGIIHPETVEQLRTLAEKYGRVTREEKLDAEELVAISQEILRAAEKIKVTDADLKYTKGQSKTLEKKIEQSFIDKAQNPDEETLTLEKIGQYTSVEEFGQFGVEEAEGGPGGAAIKPAMWGQRIHTRQNARNVDVLDLSFKELIDEKWSNLNQALTRAQRQRLRLVQQELDRRIDSGDPVWVFSAERDLRELEQAVRGDPAMIGQLDQVISPARRQELLVLNDLMDQNYTVLFDQLSDRVQKARVGDLRELSASELGAVTSGWHGVEESTMSLLRHATSTSDLTGSEGLRIWFAYKEIRNLIETNEIIQRTKVRPDPEDNIKAIYDSMEYFDKSTSISAFDTARQRLNQLLEAVRSSTLDRDRKEIVRQHVEAFERTTALLVTMQEVEGDPAELAKQAGRMNPETLHYYFDRYADFRDIDGANYLVDANGNPLTINVLSEGFNAFLRRYMEDRFKMNVVEKLQKEGLGVAAGVTETEVMNQLIASLNMQIAEEIARINFAYPNINTPDVPFETRELYDVLMAGNAVDQIWDDGRFTRIKTRAIKSWFEQNTLIGADGFQNGQSRMSTAQDNVMGVILRNRLVNAGVDQNRINDLFNDSNKVDAVRNNAYNLAKLVMSAGIDRLRIYRRSNSEHVDTMWGEDTPYLLRNTNHFLDFMLNEAQGDVRVNKIIREFLNDEYETFLLPGLFTINRFISDDVRVLPPDLAKLVTDRTKALYDEQRRRGIDISEGELKPAATVRLIQEGFDPNAGANQFEIFNINWGEKAIHIKGRDTIWDNLNDMGELWKWEMGALRNFSNDPSEENLFKMMEEFYSKRKIRKEPAMMLFLRIYEKVGLHIKEWFKARSNVDRSEMEVVIDRAVGKNFVDTDRADKFKEEMYPKVLGVSLRKPQQLMDLLVYTFHLNKADRKRPGWIFEAIWDLIKTMLGQSVSNK